MKHAALVLSAILCTSLGSARAQAPAPGGQGPRTVRVMGLGEVKAHPDEAFIELAVEAVAPSAKAAGEENARRMEKVLAALVASGLARKELETRNYSVYPEYTPAEGAQRPRLRGYRSNNTLTIHLKDLSKVGPTLDRALAAGANRVDGVRFGLSQAEGAQAEALKRAVARARASAQVMAAALGVKLGPVLDASTVAEEPPVRPMMRSAMADGAREAEGTAVQPEEQTVTARVSLVFAVER